VTTISQESDFDRAKRWGKKFLADWKAGANGGTGRGRNAAPQGPQGDIGYLLTQRDSWPAQVRAMGQTSQLHRLVIGTGGNGNFYTTHARRNLLILGPPRSEKTAGVLTPAILSHPGPVVSTSTKADVLRATGLVRARLGRVWHYSPDGAETPPGCVELRWSPIPPSARWSSAIALGKAMADISEQSNSENSAYFRTKAGVLIAALLHAAALGDKPMIWLLRAVNGERRILEEAEEVLDQSFEADTQIALSDLRGILELDERSKGPIFATTANAFAAFRLPGALASTENVNFDPAEFVAGDPEAFNPLRLADPSGEQNPDQNMMLAWQLGPKGRFDTVYITASSEQQNLVAPIVASLLSQIREAAFARHRADEAADNFTRPPVLWALDEVAGIAPMRDLPETLSQSGGQGLLLAVCLQDLQMARARWDKAADAFLTLFGNIVIHPGIRDDATLRAVSTVIGKQWVTVTSEGTTQNTGRDRQGRNSNEGYTYSATEQQVDRLDPGAVAQGRVMEHPHFVLGLTPDGWGWFFCMPYYSTPPWVQLLIGTMEYAAWSGDVLERCWELPTPILDRDHDGRNLAAADTTGANLVERYRQAVADLKQMTHSRRELLSRLGNGSLLTGYDDSWSSRLPGPQLSYIAIGHDTGQDDTGRPDLATIARAIETLSEARRAGPDEEVVITSNTADMTGRWTPMADLPTSPFVKPNWMVSFGEPRMGHTAALRLVASGGPEVARTTPMVMWGDQIARPVALIEAWSWSKPAAHMVKTLAAHLGAIAPTAVLDATAITHFGAWAPSTQEGNDNV
jgi:type IV secretion system protein VirD4